MTSSRLKPPSHQPPQWPPITRIYTFIIQRKQLSSGSIISPCAFGSSLPNCWIVFCLSVFCRTQNHHSFIQVPVSHLQLMKGHFHLIELLWNLSNLPVLYIPQSVIPVTLSKCNRAVLKHFTSQVGNVLRLIFTISSLTLLTVLVPLILQNMIPITFTQIPKHVPFTQSLTFTHFTSFAKNILISPANWNMHSRVS